MCTVKQRKQGRVWVFWRGHQARKNYASKLCVYERAYNMCNRRGDGEIVVKFKGLARAATSCNDCHVVVFFCGSCISKATGVCGERMRN